MTLAHSKSLVLTALLTLGTLAHAQPAYDEYNCRVWESTSTKGFVIKGNLHLVISSDHPKQSIVLNDEGDSVSCNGIRGFRPGDSSYIACYFEPAGTQGSLKKLAKRGERSRDSSPEYIVTLRGRGIEGLEPTPFVLTSNHTRHLVLTLRGQASTEKVTYGVTCKSIETRRR